MQSHKYDLSFICHTIFTVIFIHTLDVDDIFWALATEAICILLRRLAYPNRWTDLEVMFGLSSKSLAAIANEIMHIIFNNNGGLLSNLEYNTWLDDNRMILYAQVGFG